MVGSIIGNYRIIRQQGEGGMGVVYLGEHMLLGRRAAIKVLRPALSERPEMVNRFFNEARAATSISDPGIVQVFDFGYHTDGSAFIVMELLEGEPLDQRLAKLGRLPVDEALRLCRQLASSLAAAHARPIIHRDLKPENIFLVHDDEVASGERSKIVDFGIAKLADDRGKLKTHAGMLIGTPTYMSPEQCRGLTELDHRADIYSLGCLMFHLLTGRPPFDGAGIGDVIAAHLLEPAPAPSSLVPGIAPNVDAIVLRCLAKAPADRYQSMTEVAAAIVQVLPRVTPPEASMAMAPDYHVGVGSPPPPAYPGGEALATTPTLPMTLGGSAGQIATPPTVQRGPGRWIVAALVAVAAAVALLATRENRAPQSATRSPEGGTAQVVPPGAALGSTAAAYAAGPLDASPASTAPTSPAAGNAAPIATDARDAGVAHAASTAQDSSVALPVPQPKPPGKALRPPSSGGDHARPYRSDTPPIIDRGD